MARQQTGGRLSTRYDAQRYAERKAQHQCVRCGECLAARPRVRCGPCLAAAAAVAAHRRERLRQARHCQGCPAALAPTDTPRGIYCAACRARQRAQAHTRLEAGHCRRCPAPRVEGTVFCPRHSQESRRHYASRSRRRRSAATRRA